MTLWVIRKLQSDVTSDDRLQLINSQDTVIVMEDALYYCDKLKEHLMCDIYACEEHMYVRGIQFPDIATIPLNEAAKWQVSAKRSISL
ncbi:hypothetical protein [Alteromonas facilis]|uniref:hypothetical protein n=1 Tax=Alteromonas facilis TaxID=2048004 RepID=UPI000C2930FC|nr:hypothetical protein [Alteromonas facilis]